MREAHLVGDRPSSKAELRVDRVPDELKTRDQWLNWGGEFKNKQPHAGEDENTSWPDPSDWLTFDEARRAAENHDGWGIGYVTAVDNDNHPTGVVSMIDIDGARDPETGELADWVPTLEAFRGCYAELSLSETGIHIPVVGTDVPEWFSDVDLEDGDHEGVDLLTNKFSTVTGWKLELAGEEPELAKWSDDVEEWLARVYENLEGERPDVDDGRGHAAPDGLEDDVDGDRDDQEELEEWFDEDAAEDALGALDPDCPRDEWRDVGFALADHFPESTARRLFESWSRSGTKWDDEAEYQVEDIAGRGSGGIGIGTLIDRAKKAGWDHTEHTPSTGRNGGLTPAEAIAKHSDEFDSAEDVPTDWLEASSSGAEPGDREDDRDDDGGREHPAPDDLEDVESGAQSDERDRTTATEELSWENVRALYQAAENDDGVMKGEARQAAANVLQREYDWMYVLESETLWVYDEETGQFDQWGETLIGDTLTRELGEFYTVHGENEITARIVKADTNQVHRQDVNARSRDGRLVCVGNGVIDFETGELLEHSPEYRFTRGLSWDYPTEENELESASQKVVDWLDEVTKRPEDRDMLIDQLAHGLMPGYPFRAFVVTYGPGHNGKSRVMKVFNEFVGAENSAALEITDLADDDFATSDLPGKFINWGDDMEGDGGGKLRDLSLLKKVTGGSRIRANEKFEKTFDFTNEAAMFFSANAPPRLGSTKDAVKDRLYPIEMPYQFVNDPDPNDPMQKERVKDYEKVLTEDEAAMRGLLELVVEHGQRLLETGEFSLPEGPEERWEMYTKEADPIAHFAVTALEEGGPDAKIRKDDAYTVYRRYCDEHDEEETGSQPFKRQLPGKLGHSVEDKQSRPLATDDDDSDRVSVWSRARWTDQAARFMPDWMLERYVDHFDELEDVDDRDDRDGDGGQDELEDDRDEPGRAEPALGSRSPQFGAELTAEVKVSHDGEYDSPEAGQLEGPHGTIIGYTVPAGSGGSLEAYEGEEIRLEDVQLRTDSDGLLEAVITAAVGVTRLSEPSPDSQDTLDSSGSSDTETAADGGQETLEDDVDDDRDGRDDDDDEDRDQLDDDQESATPDDATGSRADRERVTQIVARLESPSTPVPPSVVVDELHAEHGYTVSDAETAIDRALEHGDIHREGKKTLRTT